MTTVAVVCSPNMGIVDSWLPVVSAVHDAHPEWRIVAIVPRAWGVDVRPGSIALRTLERWTERILVEVAPDGYRAVDGFAAADRLARRSARASVRLSRLGDVARRSLLRLVPGGSRVRLASLRGDLLLLMDAEVSDRREVIALREALGDPPAFSLFHGLGLLEDGGTPPAGLRPVTVAFAYSEPQRELMQRRYGLPPDRVRATGVPRHDPDHPQPVLQPLLPSSGGSEREVGEDAVLLISRPATSTGEAPNGSPRDWLPAGRKAAQLRAIHRVVCEELGLPLIVTMHPKERDDGSIREGLPASGEGRTWVISETHPLALAPRLRFAIAFSSSVAVDLLSAGVPTIELQDVTGAPAYDRPDALRDEHGRILRTSGRRSGLVLPADDEDDLRAQVRRLTEDRAEVLSTLTAAYRTLYADPRGAVATILRDLEAHASGRPPGPGERTPDH